MNVLRAVCILGGLSFTSFYSVDAIRVTPKGCMNIEDGPSRVARSPGSKIVVEGVHLIGTGSTMDLAIGGPGYLQATLAPCSTEDSTEVFYGRGGSFGVDKERRLLNTEGWYLHPQVVVPTDTVSLTFKKDGSILANVKEKIDPVKIGAIKLALFSRSEKLKMEPMGLFSSKRDPFARPCSPGKFKVVEPGTGSSGRIFQGYLEVSSESALDLVPLLAETLLKNPFSSEEGL